MSAKKKVAGIPGTDPTLPSVPLALKGHTYQLTYDFGALRLAEKATGQNLLRCINLQGIDANQLAGLLYAALLKAQPEITIEHVDSLIDLSTIDTISNGLVAAWVACFPPAESASPKAEPETPQS